MEVVEDLDEGAFAAVCCLLMGEPARRDPRMDPPAVKPETRPLLHRILRLCEEVEDQQLDFGVERMVPQDILYCGVAELWTNGFSWESTIEISGMSAGDLFRVLRRTYDLCRQVEYWDGAPPDLKRLARATSVALLRGPLEENVTFFESTEGDAQGATEGTPAEAELPELQPLPTKGEASEGEGAKREFRGKKAPRGVGRRVKLKRRRPGRPKR